MHCRLRTITSSLSNRRQTVRNERATHLFAFLPLSTHRLRGLSHEKRHRRVSFFKRCVLLLQNMTCLMDVILPTAEMCAFGTRAEHITSLRGARATSRCAASCHLSQSGIHYYYTDMCNIIPPQAVHHIYVF